jgi:hypothetical protein
MPRNHYSEFDQLYSATFHFWNSFDQRTVYCATLRSSSRILVAWLATARVITDDPQAAQAAAM